MVPRYRDEPKLLPALTEKGQDTYVELRLSAFDDLGPDAVEDLGDDQFVLKATGEPIGLELLSYRPGDARFNSVNVEVGAVR